MYRVTVATEGKVYPLLNQVLRLQNPTLKEYAGNSIGYLKFKISPDHPYYDKIHPLESELYVYEDGEEIFRGRSVTSEEEFNRTHQITCESDLAYLCDSIVRPFEFQGSIYQFMEKIINNHNSQVETRKQFQIGNINVADNNNYINRNNSDYSNSLDCLRNKLVETHGGYLRTRLRDGIRYLDYVTDAGGTNDQEIRYGINLADYNRQRDSTTLFTALIPTGADIESIREDGSVETKAVDITSVNNGVDYIYDEEAKNKYGWIFRQKKWEDVTLPENLIKKARAYLAQSIYLDDVLQLTAIDLANMGNDIGRLKVGMWTKVISKPHGVDVLYMLEERTRYLQEPGKDSISLGGTISRISKSVAKSQADMREYVQQVEQSTNKEINRKVDNATQLITGGLGGYVVIGRADNGHPEEILIMDAPTKETATNVIRINKNGIGFSNAGYNGTYRNAWTIDGNLVADFVTTGTMLADRIRGGTMEVGGNGTASDGSILIKDASGNIIGRWSKDGISIMKGIISGATATFGGVDNKSGEIKILDSSGNQIGIWNNDGIEMRAGNSVAVFRPSSTQGAIVVVGEGRYIGSGGSYTTTEGVIINQDTILVKRDIDTDGEYTELSSSALSIFNNGESEWHYGIEMQAKYAFVGTDGIYTEGNLEVEGTKNRVVDTEYGKIKLSAYETASPMFGDVGSGIICEDGKCYVHIDPMFSGTVNLNCDYQVFLQAYGPSAVWVSEKSPNHFVVSGEPGEKFAWELKAKQKGYEQDRLDKKMMNQREDDPTYGSDGALYVKQYMEGLKS